METQQPVPERCRVEWWRGYRSSTFYVRVRGELVESRPFRWSKAQPPPDGGEPRAAYDDLVARLGADGWEPESRSGTWYEAIFVRHAATVIGHAVPPRTKAPGAPAPPSKAPAESAPPAPGRHRRTPSRALVYLGASVSVALAAAGLALGSRGHADTSSTASPPGGGIAAGKARSADSAASRRPAKTRPTNTRSHNRLVDLRVAAQGNGSWLEIRRVSASGPVLYSGSLLPGTTLHFRGARLWVRTGAAGNLVITANGRPIPLQGTVDKLFLA